MDIGLVFGIIFAAIVVGFALVFGGPQIMAFFGLSGTAQLEQAVDRLSQQVDAAYNLGRGSILEFEASIPDSSKLCIIDPANPGRNIARGWDPDYAVSYYLGEPGNQYYGSNVWYFQGNEFNSKKLTRLVTEENFCVSGRATILLENLGSRVGASLE